MRKSHCPGMIALLVSVGALLGCMATDPFTSGPARASVTGVATSSGGAPLAQTTISIQCGGGAASLVLPTDSAGRYLANVSTGPDPFPGSSGRLRCQFAEPATVPRVLVDTVLGFARGPVLVVLQTVDLHEP
jgi:hypothetical protein